MFVVSSRRPHPFLIMYALLYDVANIEMKEHDSEDRVNETCTEDTLGSSGFGHHSSEIKNELIGRTNGQHHNEDGDCEMEHTTEPSHCDYTSTLVRSESSDELVERIEEHQNDDGDYETEDRIDCEYNSSLVCNDGSEIKSVERIEEHHSEDGDHETEDRIDSHDYNSSLVCSDSSEIKNELVERVEEHQSEDGDYKAEDSHCDYNSNPIIQGMTQLLHAHMFFKIIQWVPPVEEHLVPEIKMVLLFIVGIAHFKLANYEEAKLSFNACIALCVPMETRGNGDIGLCNVYLGDAEYNSQHYLKAATHYKKGIELHSTNNMAMLFHLVPPSLSTVHTKINVVQHSGMLPNWLIVCVSMRWPLRKLSLTKKSLLPTLVWAISTSPWGRTNVLSHTMSSLSTCQRKCVTASPLAGPMAT